MPSATCPSCGEKGKIGSNLIGTRIKCKKCGNSFLVAAPVGQVTATDRRLVRSLSPFDTPLARLDPS
jgi:hypothetical protein